MTNDLSKLERDLFKNLNNILPFIYLLTNYENLKVIYFINVIISEPREIIKK